LSDKIKRKKCRVFHWHFELRGQDFSFNGRCSQPKFERKEYQTTTNQGNAKKMTLDELFELYRQKQLRFKSQNTVRLYRHTLRAFATTLGRPPMISDLNSDAVERHMERIIVKGGSPASANKDRSQLLALWRFAAAKAIVREWPIVAVMTEPEAIPMGWMPDEVSQILSACLRVDGSIGTVPARHWWTGLISVLLDTGERIGAVRPLKKHHIQGGYLLVPAEFRKGRRRDRLYPLRAGTVESLRRVAEANAVNDSLFYWDRSETYIYAHFSAILRDAKLPADSRSKFHRLRRTVASAVAQAGGDPTAALDHASPKTTKRYLDPRIVGSVQVSDILAAYLRSPSPANPAQSPPGQADSGPEQTRRSG
jgi:integrase